MAIRSTIAVGIILCAASVRAAEPAPQGAISIHPSLGAEVFAWPFGYGLDGRLWLDSGPFLAVVHLAGGALAAHYDGAHFENVGALFGSYGVKAGVTLPWITARPFALIGYDRVGSSSWGPEGGTGGGRTEQNVNFEIGGRVRANQVEVVVAIRASVPFARDSTVNEPPGPPLPRAALLATLRL
ncbi:MAG TPA: hypothetical protein VI356_06905 [Myxococcales bacterium]